MPVVYNEYFVRSVSGVNSAGRGLSHANAYQTIDYAIGDVVATHGVNVGSRMDRFNLCSESAFNRTAPINWGSYSWNIASFAIIRGYTATPGDHGKADINLGGNAITFHATGQNYKGFQDLVIHNNSGNNPLLNLDGIGQWARDCEFYDNANSSTGAVSGQGTQAEVRGCNFHDCSGKGAYRVVRCIENYFKNGSTKKFTFAIDLGQQQLAYKNIISLDGSSSGILTTLYARVIRNSISGGGSTGYGFSESGIYLNDVLENVITGFSGSGGRGFESGASYDRQWDYNYSWNNSANYSFGANSTYMPGDPDPDNEDAGSSAENDPFSRTGSDTFANRLNYYLPRAVGNLRTRAKGAVNPPVSAGGFPLSRVVN